MEDIQYYTFNRSRSTCQEHPLKRGGMTGLLTCFIPITGFHTDDTQLTIYLLPVADGATSEYPAGALNL